MVFLFFLFFRDDKTVLKNSNKISRIELMHLHIIKMTKVYIVLIILGRTTTRRNIQKENGGNA